MKRVLLLALLATGCTAGNDEPEDLGPMHAWGTEAKATIPDALTLHTQVIARSCGPSNGVCHNNKEYPDLHTPANFVTAVARPCNLEVEEPENVFDGCEPEADEISVASLGLRTRIAWIAAYDEYDPETGYVWRPIRLGEPAATSAYQTNAKVLRHGDVLVDLPGTFTVEAGSVDAKLENLYTLPYEVYLAMMQVEGGDPNGNGVFGASDAWQMIAPGRPDKSYVIGRLTGTVPGSRMPLANQPPTNVEYVALHCWIETIGSHPKPQDAIDYDSCRYARNPTDWEATLAP